MTTTLTREAASQHTATGNDVTVTSNVTSSYSRDAAFYFQCIVVVVGILGAAANALVLYAMAVSGQHKKQLLIFNQNALDLASCLFLVLTYSMKLCNIQLSGVVGYWLCMMILSENVMWWTIVGSTINLISITVERYLKVVHSIWSKKWLRTWMIYSAMAFAWIGGFITNAVPIFLTSAVKDGTCHSVAFWESQAAKLAYGIWYFVSFYAIVLLFFVFCYSSILITIRRQANVMSSYTTAQKKSNQIQSNVIKTMLFVSAFFVITWTPLDVYYLLVMIDPDLSLLDTGYYALMSVAFMYICTNPFIYAVNFDPVRRTLLSLIPWVDSPEATQSSELIDVRSGSSARTAPEQYVSVRIGSQVCSRAISSLN